MDIIIFNYELDFRTFVSLILFRFFKKTHLICVLCLRVCVCVEHLRLTHLRHIHTRRTHHYTSTPIHMCRRAEPQPEKPLGSIAPVRMQQFLFSRSSRSVFGEHEKSIDSPRLPVACSPSVRPSVRLSLAPFVWSYNYVLVVLLVRPPGRPPK